VNLVRISVVVAVAVSLVLVQAAAPAWAQKAVFVVRHAERADQTPDSPLSGQGRARAESLARLLRDAGVSAIFVSQFQRTTQTAQPLAAMLKVSPVVVPAADVAGLVRRVQGADSNRSVLIVGHSDTVPAIVKALGCVEEIVIDVDDFDRLFVVVPRAVLRPALLELHF
jgi:phosphohistidine phosphatase SixA